MAQKKTTTAKKKTTTAKKPIAKKTNEEVVEQVEEVVVANIEVEEVIEEITPIVPEVVEQVEEVVVANIEVEEVIEEITPIVPEVVEQLVVANIELEKVVEVANIEVEPKEYKVSNEDYQWFLERKSRIQLRDVSDIYEKYEKITGKKARKGCTSCKGTFKPLISEIIKIAEDERRNNYI